MKKRRKLNAYNFKVGIVFLDGVYVFAPNRKEARRIFNDSIVSSDILLKDLDKKDNYYKIEKIKLTEKDVIVNSNNMFIYEE